MATGPNATSTFEGNLNVKGTLKVGNSSVYISETGISNTSSNSFSIGGSAGTLSVSAIGFGTTTLSGLNISGSATSTSNVGFSISSGCYAIGTTCIGGGGAYGDTNVNTFISGSTTIAKLYTNNTWAGTNTFNSTLTIGTLNGPLQANNGIVSATTSIGTIYGGTGWTNILANSILLGNGTGKLATTSAGTNGQVLALVGGVPTWTATTTAGTGLTYNGTSFNLDLANANSWTGLQTFQYSSSTIYSSFNTASTTNLVINGSSFNNLLGSGLSLSTGSLTCTTADTNTFGCLTSTN
jgi:hypothetical protein